MRQLQTWCSVIPLCAVIVLLCPGSRAQAAAPDGMVLVPAGEFRMGSDDAHADERPAHRVRVSAFYIDRTEVTNIAFAEYVRKTGRFDTIEGSWFRYYAPGCRDIIAYYEKRHGVTLDTFEADSDRSRVEAARWRAATAALNLMPEGDHAALPVRGVTWRDAAGFALWAGKRLPTEAEWEKAARGTNALIYPWGNEWKPELCRAGLDPESGPVAVGSFPEGASVYGCLDMAGNVWEWVADWYGEDYYASSGNRVDPTGPEGLPDGRLPSPSPHVDLLRTVKQGRETDTRKVIRGGAWSGPMQGHARFHCRGSRRLWSNPSYWPPDIGFRCAMDAE